MSDFSNLSKKENRELDNSTITEVSIIEKLNANNLPELIGWKEKQETLLKENPYVEITDSKTYDLACKSRTNLLKGRTELEKQDKAIASKVAQFRKDVGSKTSELIEITLTAEQKQQIEVKRWEGIKEAEKAEKERLENERIERIKNKASELESSAFEVIQKMTYSSIISDSDKVAKSMETDFDFEEFDILFTNAFSRVQNALEEKVKDLTEREDERIAKEKAEVELKRSQKLISSGFSFAGNNYFVSDFKRLDMGTILMLSEHEFESVVSAGVEELNRLKEIEESKQKSEEEKAKKEKDAIFEIRKNRLAEIGIIRLQETSFFEDVDGFITIVKDEIYDADTIDFENFISDAKKSIQKSKDDAIELTKQKEADEKASKADAEKLKSENKARVKKFAKDKKTLSGLIATVDYPDSVFVLENEESKYALNSFIVALADFKKEWIGNIEKI